MMRRFLQAVSSSFRWVTNRWSGSSSMNETARDISRALAQNLLMEDTAEDHDLGTMLRQIKDRVELLLAHQASLVELEAMLVNEWIPRIAIAAGDRGVCAESEFRDVIGRGNAAITALEARPVGGKPSVSSAPDRIALGLTRVHEWIFLAQQEASPDTQSILSRVAKQLTQLMELAEIHPVNSIGRFDPDLQSIVEVRPTRDENLDMNVAETIRPGYICGGKVLKPEQVAVHTFQSGN
jgi:GrpE